MDIPLEWSTDEKSLVKGFIYSPDHEDNCITRYRLEASVDGKTWTEVYANKRFDNIVNNPVPQKVIFSKPIEAKALRLIPVETREDDGFAAREFTAIL